MEGTYLGARMTNSGTSNTDNAKERQTPTRISMSLFELTTYFINSLAIGRMRRSITEIIQCNIPCRRNVDHRSRRVYREKTKRERREQGSSRYSIITGILDEAYEMVKHMRLVSRRLRASHKGAAWEICAKTICSRIIGE